MQSNWPRGDGNKAPLGQATLLPAGPGPTPAALPDCPLSQSWPQTLFLLRDWGAEPPFLPLEPWKQCWEVGTRSELAGL